MKRLSQSFGRPELRWRYPALSTVAPEEAAVENGALFRALKGSENTKKGSES